MEGPGVTLPDPATRPVAPRLAGLTERQKAPGRHLKAIHDHQRQNMALLREIIARARAGALPEGGAEAALAGLGWLQNLRSFGALCGQHCQIVHMHHSIEDAHVFPALSEAAEGFRAVVRRLEEEHEAVHGLLLRLVGELNALHDRQTPEAFEAAVQTYGALEGFLLSHLGYEEDSIGDALGYFEIGV